MDDIIRKLALANALKFNGTANPKAIIGGLMQECPGAKKDMKSTMQRINEIVNDINSLSLKTQEQQLLALDPDYTAKQEDAKQQRKAKANELPELSNAKQGHVVTRIPPEPSKYAHLGHAMSFLINYLYAKKYGGKVILRFDDTNPGKSSDEFVAAIKDDVLNYLGCDVDEIVVASDHMQQYYSYADMLIEQGHAYVCCCDNISQLRREGVDCQHRSYDKEKIVSIWSDMKRAKTTNYVLRLKINMQHKNAVMRDPVIFRVVTEPHYRTKQEYFAWPMYDFETTVEEGLCGVTHVLRSNEFDQRIELQNYLATLLGFPEVTYRHYGRYNVTGATTKGREIRNLIDSGDYIGWDDPRLMTLKALRRRGILPEAYVRLAKQIGLSKTQTNLDFSVIAAVNRNLLDTRAKRLFGVLKPVCITVTGIPENFTEINLSYHPHEQKGTRRLPVTTQYFIERDDNDNCDVGMLMRLMDCMNIKKVGPEVYVFDSFEYGSYSKGAGLIHYIPHSGDELKAVLVCEDTTEKNLLVEQNGSYLKPGDIVQFERHFFARLDHVRKDGTLVFWFAHG